MFNYMISEACCGMLLFAIVMALTHVLIVWLFYRLYPENEWYSENYHQLPKCLRIFDKD